MLCFLLFGRDKVGYTVFVHVVYDHVEFEFKDFIAVHDFAIVKARNNQKTVSSAFLNGPIFIDVNWMENRLDFFFQGRDRLAKADGKE